jgi:hypothetical protein
MLSSVVTKFLRASGGSAEIRVARTPIPALNYFFLALLLFFLAPAARAFIFLMSRAALALSRLISRIDFAFSLRASFVALALAFFNICSARFADLFRPFGIWYLLILKMD